MVRRTEALDSITRSGFDNAVRRGALVRAFPGVYVAADRVGDPATRLRAAVAYGGPGSALSHTTALSLWRLLDDVRPVREPLHLMVPPARRLRAAGIVVHRRSGIRPGVRHGLPVTRVEQSIVDSWSLLGPRLRRAPVIRAVAGRMTTPGRLRNAVLAVPNLPCRADLLALVHLLDVGCRSELEIWGHVEIFRAPGMPRFRWQHKICLGGRSVYLDAYAEAERVNVELDGAAWHGSTAQRERDLRRDAGLAAQGILVVRYSHERLLREPAAVRHELLAILRTRRDAAA